MAIADEAKLCADAAPVGMFGIDDVMIAISVIELGFKLWQACSSSSSASDAETAANMAGRVPANFRRARRRVSKAARSKNLDLTTENLNGLTAHMLKHVSTTDTEALGVCCSEPPIEDDTDD